MAAVPVMISGVLWNHAWRRGEAVTLMGEATIYGLEVGGGPIYPPGQPPGIWGPNDPRPTPPIYWPGFPGGGGGGGGQPGHPEHPIWGPPGSNFPGGPGYPPVAGHPLPEPPEGLPDNDGFVKPPPPSGGWSYHQEYGWGYYPAGSAAGPKGQQGSGGASSPSP